MTRMVMAILDIHDPKTGFRDLRAVVTNVVVWSQVEAGVAVTAACLPTLRPLFLKNPIDSLIGSMRSMLSLNSIERSHNAERRDSDKKALTSGNGMNFDSVQVAESKCSNLETQVTANSREHVDIPPMPADRIMIHDGIAFKEEHLGDL